MRVLRVTCELLQVAPFARAALETLESVDNGSYENPLRRLHFLYVRGCAWGLLSKPC